MELRIKKLEKIVEYLQDYAESCNGLTGEEYFTELTTLIEGLNTQLEELQGIHAYYNDPKRKAEDDAKLRAQALAEVFAGAEILAGKRSPYASDGYYHYTFDELKRLISKETFVYGSPKHNAHFPQKHGGVTVEMPANDGLLTIVTYQDYDCSHHRCRCSKKALPLEAIMCIDDMRQHGNLELIKTCDHATEWLDANLYVKFESNVTIASKVGYRQTRQTDG